MTQSEIRCALVGAGYIASWHATAIAARSGMRVSAICDTSPAAAQGLAEALGVPALTDLDALLSDDHCDAVHVLTPPQSHRDIAIAALNAGKHVLVEKPVALSSADAGDMIEAAERSGKVLGVGHNFLGTPSYVRLKQAIQAGALGQISVADFNWRFPLVPLRSGPFGLWMLREPKNLLFELGPHLFAFAVDLFGPVTDATVVLGKPIDVPGLGPRPQSWRILARAGDVDVAFNLSLVETFDDRSVTVVGSSGIGRLNVGLGTLQIERENTADIIANPFLRQTSLAWQNLREGVLNAAVQASSLNRKSPYALGFRETVNAFGAAIEAGTKIDDRFSGQSARDGLTAIESVLENVPDVPAPTPATSRKPKPSVLVIGGTGFIGRYLVRGLVAAGRDVRVLSRGKSGPFADLADHVELVSCSMKDVSGLTQAMEGCDAVYHLAKAEGDTWDAYLENDVKVTEGIAEAALAAGVKRFIYTGTIASYDMSSSGTRITEDTGFGPDLMSRNLYARSKAACEARLIGLHEKRGLPLIIARPGIVLGKEGPLQHWGIGRWAGPSAVKLWNSGHNRLPFVLVEDVADGLIAMLDESKMILGHSFNLTADPALSAHAYFDGIAQLANARIKVNGGAPGIFFCIDRLKYGLKRYVLRKPNVQPTSLKDWKSRGHLARFDNSKAKTVLGWQPEEDRDAFLHRAIVEARLFGF